MSAAADLTAALEQGKLRSLEVAIFGAWRDVGISGSLAGHGAEVLAAELVKAAQDAEDEYAAFVPVIRQYLVAGGLKGEPLEDLHNTLTDAACRAWLLAKGEAGKKIDRLTVPPGTEH